MSLSLIDALGLEFYRLLSGPSAGGLEKARFFSSTATSKGGRQYLLVYFKWSVRFVLEPMSVGAPEAVSVISAYQLTKTLPLKPNPWKKILSRQARDKNRAGFASQFIFDTEQELLSHQEIINARFPHRD